MNNNDLSDTENELTPQVGSVLTPGVSTDPTSQMTDNKRKLGQVGSVGSVGSVFTPLEKHALSPSQEIGNTDNGVLFNYQKIHDDILALSANGMPSWQNIRQQLTLQYGTTLLDVAKEDLITEGFATYNQHTDKLTMLN